MATYEVNTEKNQAKMLNLTVALFLSAPAIVNILGSFTASPALLTMAGLYALLFVSLCVDRVAVRKCLYGLFPIAIMWFVWFITWFFYPERHSFYATSLYNIKELLFPIYGVYITSVCLLQEDTKDRLRSLKLSAYLLFVLYFYQALDVITDGVWTRGSIYNGEIVTIESNYNLRWGYDVFVVCIIFFTLYFLEKKKKYLVYSTICLAGIFLYGSRGALLMFFVYFLLIVMFYSNEEKTKRTMTILTTAVIALVVAASGVLQGVLLTVVTNLGIHSRTLEKMLNGTLMDTSSRADIYRLIIQKILERPITGWGIYADRYFLNMRVQGGSAYSHNILFEMCISFGIFGLLFFCWILGRSISMLLRYEDISRRLVVLVCLGGCLPLLLSLSFWYQPLFWALLAVVITDAKECRDEALLRQKQSWQSTAKRPSAKAAIGGRS